MNSLLILPDELLGGDKAFIHGERYSYVKAWHKLEVGLEVTALLLNKKAGKAKVLEISERGIDLQVTFNKPPPLRLPLSLIIAVPRPQTVKKILETAAAIGCQKIIFLRSDNVVKSYLQSKTLTEDQLLLHLYRGMEQACDPIQPEIEVFERGLKDYFKKEDADDKSSRRLRLVADTAATLDQTISKAFVEGASLPIELFIGPESGWSSEEINEFTRQKSHNVSLGDRMLRVETALAVAYGEIRSALISSGITTKK